MQTSFLLSWLETPWWLFGVEPLLPWCQVGRWLDGSKSSIGIMRERDTSLFGLGRTASLVWLKEAHIALEGMTQRSPLRGWTIMKSWRLPFLLPCPSRRRLFPSGKSRQWLEPSLDLGWLALPWASWHSWSYWHLLERYFWGSQQPSSKMWDLCCFEGVSWLIPVSRGRETSFTNTDGARKLSRCLLWNFSFFLFCMRVCVCIHVRLCVCVPCAWVYV